MLRDPRTPSPAAHDPACGVEAGCVCSPPRRTDMTKHAAQGGGNTPTRVTEEHQVAPVNPFSSEEVEDLRNQPDCQLGEIL